MKAIQFTGLRLGATYEGWPEDGARIRQKQRDLLAELFNRARESEASLLISAGDLFDAPTVPMEEVDHVLELCRRHSDVTLATLPGGRDPWGSYTVYHHLKAAELPNLVVLQPALQQHREVIPGVWVYALPVDATSESPVGLQELVRQEEDGHHIAVVYAGIGRLQEGPEEGLVMVSPSVASHAFDWLALADGGPSERIGSTSKPATYAGPLITDRSGPRESGTVWSVKLAPGGAEVTAVRINGIRLAELTIAVDEMTNTASVAAKIRREADPSDLMCVTLKGVRPADHPIIGPSLRARCARDFLGFQVVDESEIGPPSAQHSASTLVSALWDNYQASSAADRQAWADALMLYASGITDPTTWKEAPWARL